MTENECIDLIEKSVQESFQTNTKVIEESICKMAKNHYPSTMEGLASLYLAVLDYAMDVSEITCISVIKVLTQAGILDVRMTEKED